MSEKWNRLLPGLKGHDRRALAEAISLLEQGVSPEELWPQLPPPVAPGLVVGITGAGGAGKSTLVAALVPLLRDLGFTVAVLACDPSSPRSGGALLGDRVRVEPRPADSGFYFRSLSTRGAPGGISPAVEPGVELLRRLGFQIVLVETVGVGQDQYAIRPFVERLLLVLSPATGDEIQLQKAGVIELADVIAVNKADLAGADILIALLRECLPEIPVVPVVATTSQGLPRLWQSLQPVRPPDSNDAANQQ